MSCPKAELLPAIEPQQFPRQLNYPTKFTKKEKRIGLQALMLWDPSHNSSAPKVLIGANIGSVFQLHLVAAEERKTA